MDLGSAVLVPVERTEFLVTSEMSVVPVIENKQTTTQHSSFLFPIKHNSEMMLEMEC